ncbi:MAG TPA: glycosyl hydrolase [Anaerolineales bacterium]
MRPKPWPEYPASLDHFRHPPREYGILPFWFLNGELDPDEMRFQLRELCEKGLPGIILHGRFGLELTYLGPTYLDRIQLAVEEAEKLGLKTWIYDEMNWPSGTADKRVLETRPDLAERYIECINFTIRGPWFTYLTGADSRYLDFERSTPVAAFAVRLDGPDKGQVIDLTPNLSFEDVIPWEAPPGSWRLIYIVEKKADYYIDALDPEATGEFLRQGYDPYARSLAGKMSTQMLGFYTDEPAMHYYLSGADNPVVPWTKDMFRRFQERNGYNLRPRLPDLFFDISPESPRVRYDFYASLTEFYSQAFYQQIHEWCQQHEVLFTGHLLYEEWLRRLVRVEGNIFKHYEHMDVIGVDHLYPIIGTRDRPDEHVAMKVGSSAAHQLGSPRLLCESFGGIFMDATMQRMKWIADWEYVLGVNLLNPHGFHYTLEGPRKRDWPPSQFYQYPWWHYYAEFNNYIGRLSHMLSGGRHVARVAVIWPVNAMFGAYIPQTHTALADRTEGDLNALTDLLLRVHYDFDYLDEDYLADRGEIASGSVRIRDEAYPLIILPPMAFIKLSTVEKLEQFVSQGGRVLGAIFLPDRAFSPGGLENIAGRIEALFGVDPTESQQNFAEVAGIELTEKEHPGGGKTGFLRSHGIVRQLPQKLQRQRSAYGGTDSPSLVIESEYEDPRYFVAFESGERQDITADVNAERQELAQAFEAALNQLVAPDVVIDNPEVFYLHRVKDGRDIYFLVNPTYRAQPARVTITCDVQPVRWDPSTGEEQVIAPSQVEDGRTSFSLELPAVGSTIVLAGPEPQNRVIGTNLQLDNLGESRASGYARASHGYLVVERGGNQVRMEAQAGEPGEVLLLEGEWEFAAENDNALVIGQWLVTAENPNEYLETYTQPGAGTSRWLPMVPGAWSYQLPAEPEGPYPIPVWYRIRFQAGYLPPHLNLIVDGFAGSDWQLFVNGEALRVDPVRSSIDSQMGSIDIKEWVRLGENLIALRLTVTKATDGLVDLLKLTGDFCLEVQADGSYALAAPRRTLQPAPWTSQGYPFYSGRGVYRRLIELPAGLSGKRIYLEPELTDDVLEVVVNGKPAGIRLWKPYGLEITDLLKAGENSLELRVANTLVNLLEALERPSGLAGAPRLVPYNQFSFDLLQ